MARPICWRARRERSLRRACPTSPCRCRLADPAFRLRKVPRYETECRCFLRPEPASPSRSGDHLAAEKLVPLDSRATPDDLAVLHEPQLRVAVPVAQVLAVEKVFDVLF